MPLSADFFLYINMGTAFQLLYLIKIFIMAAELCKGVGEGGGITARLRLNEPWLENCVRQDCDISHSE